MGSQGGHLSLKLLALPDLAVTFQVFGDFEFILLLLLLLLPFGSEVLEFSTWFVRFFPFSLMLVNLRFYLLLLPFLPFLLLF